MRRKLKLLLKNLQRLHSKYLLELSECGRNDFERRSLVHSKFVKENRVKIDEFEEINAVTLGTYFPSTRHLYSIDDRVVRSNIAVILRKTSYIPSRTLTRIANAAKKKNQKFPLDFFIDNYKIVKDLREIKFV